MYGCNMVCNAADGRYTVIDMLNTTIPVRRSTAYGVLVAFALGTIIGGLCTAPIVDDVPINECQDSIMNASEESTCPPGTTMEIQVSNGDLYAVCHCKQPLRFIIIVPSEQDPFTLQPESSDDDRIEM